MDDVTLLCQLHTSGRNTAGKLHSAGYDTLESISESQVGPLINVVGLTANAARRLIDAAAEMMDPIASTINTELLGLDEQDDYEMELTKGVTLDESAALDELTISAAPDLQYSEHLDDVSAKSEMLGPEPEDEPEPEDKLESEDKPELVCVPIEPVLAIRERLIELVALSIANRITG